jgi:hypothetical protein
MNEAIDLVSGCETRNLLMSVLINAPSQIACDSDVERSGTVRHDVDPIRFHSGLVSGKLRLRSW